MLKMLLKRKTDAMKGKKKGFTLIEVIVVIVIIAILAAIAVPSLTRYISTAEQKSVQAMAHNIQVVMQAERADKFEETFAGTTGSPATGATAAYTGGPTYKEILDDNGVMLATPTGTDLSNLVWDGRTLKSFAYAGEKYQIAYDSDNGFGKIDEVDTPFVFVKKTPPVNPN